MDGAVPAFDLATNSPPGIPAEELAAIYRQRWEIELAFDELKNHLDHPGRCAHARPKE
ncbi:transposase [Actinomadura sp. 3N407]|uniref:transposase n=1 Tax=Actinomadura sp. 3N407 TaxID=3457423 RepID=UPI003FCE8C5D